ncbi:MAG: hypothetical protein H6623_01690 [Bdellovibrionaceae bacterium]|nr:hypothetical protein [Pseudobdellovibrionaceae bacterium]
MQSLYVYGRDIKTVNLSENEIYPLTLVLGKTTLLRFSEKPQKIIFGNKNYFNIENADRDVALQPLSRVSTNMFVYTEKQTFGFDVSVCESCRGDDFIKVFAKSEKPNEVYQKIEVDEFIEKSFKKDLSIKDLKFSFQKVKSNSDIVLIDFIATAKKSTSSKTIKISMKGKDPPKLDVVFENATIDKEKVRGRIVVYQNPKRSFDLSIQYLKQTRFLRIERSLLK